MEIKRDIYLEKMIRRKHNGMVKIITGVRRCGKSYLLNQLFYRHLLTEGVSEDHIIRFAFDSATDLVKIGEDLIALEKKNKKADPNKFITYIQTQIKDASMYYLLLDEVQMMDAFESVLNGYLREENIDLYVTGSNAKFLSSDIVTEFAGRGDEIRMYPLSFSEFMSFYKGDRYEGLSQYMLYGGIPLVVLREDDRDKADTLRGLFEEVYIRDIAKRNRVRNEGEIEELIDTLASTTGALTNPEKLKNTFRTVKKSKITAATIKKYISYLEDAFLIDGAKRYDIKGRAYIETPQKYYFSDPGLRNARLNFRQFEPSHLMENVIYNELKVRGYRVDVGVVPVVERDAKGKQNRKQLEVDFVCNIGSRRCYIQSAYSIPDEKKRQQEKRSLLNVKDAFEKVIITNDMVPRQYDENGLLTMNVYDFLLDLNSIE